MTPSDPIESSPSRAVRLRQVVRDCQARRATGEHLPDEAVTCAHPHLMPELGRELRMLGMIARARQQAATSTGGSAAPQRSAPTDDDALPVIPGYKILDEIHRGGQGIVYRATQLTTQRRVALKLLRDGQFASRRERMRFEREVLVLGTLRHPNIVTIHDSGTVGGCAFLVMDYIPGQALDQWIANCELRTADSKARRRSAQTATRNSQSAIDPLLRLFVKICRAIHVAHLHGVIHRDLKPSNIRIDESGEPHVLDFGLAKLATEVGSDGAAPSPDDPAGALKTITGQFVGSLPWAAPEQAEGRPEKIDVRTDVYALGVMLYQMLTGRFPYEVVGNIRDVVDHILHSEPARPSTFRRGIGDEMETIVLKCLSKELERRYQSAGELGDDLQRYLEGEPISAKRESTLYVLRKQLRRYRSVALVAAVFVVVLTVFAAISAHQARANRRLAESESRAKLQTMLALNTAERERAVAVAARAQADEQAERYRRSLYISRIAQASSALDDNRVLTAVTLLKQCPEDLRGWEWSYLHRLSDTSETTFAGHTERVTSVVFSPDGAQVVSADMDGNLEVWQTATGQHLRHFESGQPTALDMAFRPDGTWLAVAGHDGVTLLDSHSGQQLAALRGQKSAAWSVAVRPDGRTLASGGGDGTLKLWDADTYQELLTFNGHRSIVRCAQFSPDGAYLVSASDDGTLRLWNVSSGEQVWMRPAQHPLTQAVAFSPDGCWLATGGDDARVYLWEVATGNRVRTLEHADSVESIAFSPDGRWLAAGRYNGTITIWNVTTGIPLRTLRGHFHAISSLASLRVQGSGFRVQESEIKNRNSQIHPQSAGDSPLPEQREWLLASGSRDSHVKLWNPFATQQIRSLHAHERSAGWIAFSRDGEQLLSTGADVVKVWDVRTLELVRALPHPKNVHAACFTPDGRFVVSGCDDKLVHIWDTATGALLRTLEGHLGPVGAVAVNPSGERVLSGGEDGMLAMWNLVDGQRLYMVAAHDRKISSVNFSPDGKRAVSGAHDGTLAVWDAATGRNLWTIDSQSQLIFVALFTPDGKYVLTASRETSMRLWDAQTGQHVRSIPGPTGSLYAAALSPDGRRVLSGGYNTTLKLSDVLSGEELLILNEIRSQIYYCVAFSPNGQLIAAADRNGTITIWSADDERHGAGEWWGGE
ncbi:MAG TPA: protein kinase [Phycisphaerae bacterium]